MTSRKDRQAQESLVRLAREHKGQPVTAAELAGPGFKLTRRQKRNLPIVVDKRKLKKTTYRRPWRPDEYEAVPPKRKWWQRHQIEEQWW